MAIDHKAVQILAHTPHPTPTTVATALSHAFPAAPEWTVAALASVGTDVLGARRRWLGPLVRAVVGSYHRKHADAPRELAAHIAVSDPFVAAVDKARQQRKPLRLASYAVAGPEVRDAAFPVPEVLTVALFDDVAVTGFDDEAGIKTPRQDFPGGAFVVMVAA